MDTKHILITGVSRGLGLECTKLLLESGYAVTGISRSYTKELQAIQELYPNAFDHIPCDLTDWKNLKTTVFQKFDYKKTPIYGLINNAAVAYDDLISNMDQAKLESMFEVNVFSSLMLSKLVIRNMLLHDTQGSLVHVSSISTQKGYKGLSMYAATKGALEAFSKSVSREWGARRIRSNCVVVGFMETSMSAKLSDLQRKKIFNRTALKEPTQIKSVASTIEFLLGDGAQSITGQNILVDSGSI